MTTHSHERQGQEGISVKRLGEMAVDGRGQGTSAGKTWAQGGAAVLRVRTVGTAYRLRLEATLRGA